MPINKCISAVLFIICLGLSTATLANPLPWYSAPDSPFGIAYYYLPFTIEKQVLHISEDRISVDYQYRLDDQFPRSTELTELDMAFSIPGSPASFLEGSKGVNLINSLNFEVRVNGLSVPVEKKFFFNNVDVTVLARTFDGDKEVTLGSFNETPQATALLDKHAIAYECRSHSNNTRQCVITEPGDATIFYFWKQPAAWKSVTTRLFLANAASIIH